MALTQEQSARRRARGVNQAIELIRSGKPTKHIVAQLKDTLGISRRTAHNYLGEARKRISTTDDEQTPITSRNYEDERMRMAAECRDNAARLHIQAQVLADVGNVGADYRQLLAEARQQRTAQARLLHFHITPPDRFLGVPEVRQKFLAVFRGQAHFLTEAEMADIELTFAEERARRALETKVAKGETILERL